MSNSERTPDAALSGSEVSAETHLEGSRVVAADYGMPGTKGLDNPLKPLLWLLLPFFFCLAYGLWTR
jgi:hypothetical protein